jgi:AraC-like DNA-binding protein
MATRDTTHPCRLAALGLATEGAVRVAPVINLPRFMTAQGLDADAVIRAQGCDPSLFTDPDNIIAFSAIGRLLARVAECTGCAYPGLEVARQRGLDASGPVGRAARLAPDVGTALRTFILSAHLHDRGAVPYLWADEHKAMFGYTLCCPDVIGTDHIHDGALAIAYNMLRELAGPRWQATEVRLFRAAPADKTPFRKHFRAPLRFGAEQTAIVFLAADLARPCVDADAQAYARAMSDLETLNATSGIGFAEQVHRVLQRLLLTGVSVGGTAPDRATVCALYALNPRTLNRRLRDEGTTFAALLAQARYDIARALLRETRLTVQDIACTLGYAGTGPFTLAFRHWSGMTAATWRARQRGN